MGLTYFYSIVLLGVSLLSVLAVMIRAWPNRHNSTVKAFLLLMTAIAWWLPCAIMENISPGLSHKMLWMKIEYLGIATLPVAWLVFTLEYTDRAKWLTPRTLGMLLILPAVTQIMVWTNDLHHLMWSNIQLDTRFSPPVDVATPSTWFWVHAAYSYVLILMGDVYLFNLFFKTTSIYRKQVGLMLLATLVPWLANFLFISKIGLPFVVDPTPMAFAITGGVFFWGLSRAKLLNLMPIAYETIFTSMIDSVIIVDVRNRIIEANPSALRLFNKKSTEMTGKILNQIFPESVYASINDTGTVPVQSEIILGQGQSRCFYEMFVSPIVKGKQLNGKLILLHDNTEKMKADAESREKAVLEAELNERKKAEKALSDSEARFQALTEQSPVMICNVDLEGNIQYINKKFEEVTQFHRNELIGKNSFKIGMFSSKSLVSLKQRLAAGLAGAETRRTEVKFRRKDKEWIWISLMAEPIKEAGRLVGLQFIAQDITEQRQAEAELRESEAKYRTVFESANDILILIDRQGKIIDVNVRIKDIGGYDREMLVGQNIRSLTGIMSKKSLAIVVMNFLKRTAGFKVPPYEIEMIRQDGTLAIFEINAIALYKEGKVAGDLAVLRDITERTQAEKKIQSLYEQEKKERQELEEEARARAQFINVLAHELRTPLTPILISIETIRDFLSTNPDSVHFKLINNALSGAESLRNRLEELLDLARFTRGAFKLRLELIDTGSFIERIAAHYLPVIEQNHQRLIVEILPDLPEVQADPSRLEQVLLNLLSNASKYSPKDREITLRARMENGNLLVEVQDQGIGIALENQKMLFQPYHRVEQDRQNFPGIGLGLAVSKQIIEAHKGQIWVESEAERGSRFKFTLPVTPGESKVDGEISNYHIAVKSVTP